MPDSRRSRVATESSARGVRLARRGRGRPLPVGRRLRKPLAAQPRGELPPVGGIGALGVVRLRRAGIRLGGLRQRRQPPAQAPGGREQGRGVRAGSPGLRAGVFPLPVLRAVSDASVRTALRVGSRAAVGRAGLLSAPTGAGRAGALGGAASSRRSFGPGRDVPPGVRSRAKRGDGGSFAGVPAAAGPANSGGREGAPAAADPGRVAG